MFKNSKYKKKEKEPKRKKLPHSRKKSLKYFVIPFSVLLVFVSVSGVLAMGRTALIASNQSQTKATIVKVAKDLATVKATNIRYTPALENFMQAFIKVYINLPSNQKDFDLRTEQLDTYLATGLDHADVFQMNESRSLVETKFQDLSLENGVKTAKFSMKYKVISGDKTSEVTNILCVPYEESAQGFSVIANPYVSDFSTDKAKEKALENKMASEPKYTNDDKKGIETFLNEFFKKYAEDSKKEMKYLMKSPESLNGSVGFKEVKSDIYKTKKGFTVKSEVSFVEKGSKISRHEQMTLELSKNESTYFVEKMSHNLGGK